MLSITEHKKDIGEAVSFYYVASWMIQNGDIIQLLRGYYPVNLQIALTIDEQ